jgi:CRISPR/Cas system CSM-associated protein Csm4 (group 5 of RAMP superfamily)
MIASVLIVPGTINTYMKRRFKVLSTEYYIITKLLIGKPFHPDIFFKYKHTRVSKKKVKKTGSG